MAGTALKIRIGVGLGPHATPGGFAEAIDAMEAAGVDSVWLSEMVFGEQIEPMIGMTHALARTRTMKVGTGVTVLPGRNPVLVAKQLVSLAGLAPKRVLPVFGLKPGRRGELGLFKVPEGKRAAVFDESLHVLRALVRGETVDFDGEHVTVHAAFVGPVPAKPLDIWLGGSAPGGLRRVGRYGDGWLGSFLTPPETLRAKETIERAAADAGREIDADHYGLTLPIALHGLPDSFVDTLRAMRPDTDPRELVAHGWEHAAELLRRHIDSGLSKFVLRALDGTFPEFLDGFTTTIVPLQN